jgi:hypothetical protein
MVQLRQLSLTSWVVEQVHCKKKRKRDGSIHTPDELLQSAMVGKFLRDGDTIHDFGDDDGNPSLSLPNHNIIVIDEDPSNNTEHWTPNCWLAVPKNKLPMDRMDCNSTCVVDKMLRNNLQFSCCIRKKKGDKECVQNQYGGYEKCSSTIIPFIYFCNTERPSTYGDFEGLGLCWAIAICNILMYLYKKENKKHWYFNESVVTTKESFVTFKKIYRFESLEKCTNFTNLLLSTHDNIRSTIDTDYKKTAIEKIKKLNTYLSSESNDLQSNMDKMLPSEYWLSTHETSALTFMMLNDLTDKLTTSIPILFWEDHNSTPPRYKFESLLVGGGCHTNIQYLKRSTPN